MNRFKIIIILSILNLACFQNLLSNLLSAELSQTQDIIPEDQQTTKDKLITLYNNINPKSLAINTNKLHFELALALALSGYNLPSRYNIYSKAYNAYVRKFYRHFDVYNNKSKAVLYTTVTSVITLGLFVMARPIFKFYINKKLTEDLMNNWEENSKNIPESLAILAEKWHQNYTENKQKEAQAKTSKFNLFALKNKFDNIRKNNQIFNNFRQYIYTHLDASYNYFSKIKISFYI